MRKLSLSVVLFAFVLSLSAAKQPNVVLVITDDQGYGDLSCHGNPILKTPHLDKLHSESVWLSDYHVAPTCSPTRAALITCLLYTSDGADEEDSGDLGGRRIIK